ncbi:hypothetical protein IEQ34_024465 [Dendrobium chrysotoxum]|uniref:Secreted protein n=1 Tax=Dendrobium chrysotoxum TaxID=161865 RepID=A0AAV7FTE8_DENCH|nr:hypothetical protein IEQ34_024465 [Dendrobium chrysotoxum]
MEELSFLLGWLLRASNWLLRPVRSASEVTVAWLNVEQSATEAFFRSGILNALATALHGSIRTAPSIHRLRLGLLGYLIPFAPLAFVSQCQCRPSRVLSPLVSFRSLRISPLHRKFPTAASRRSLGRVSVPVWLIIRKDQLLIIALTKLIRNCLSFQGRRLVSMRFNISRSQQYSHPYPITSIPQASYPFSFDRGGGASPNRKTPIGFRDNQARTDDFHHVKVTLYR